MKKIIIIIIFLFLITGCYNYREIDLLGNVTSIIIHYENNEFKLTIEVAEATPDGNISYLIHTSGLSFERAINNANQNYHKILYFANLDLMLLTHDSLNKIDSVIRYINRDLHFSYNFNLAITNDTKELIQFVEEYDAIFGLFIRQIMNNNYNNRYNITYLNFLNDFVNKNRIIIPALNINDEQINFNLIEVQS